MLSCKSSFKLHASRHTFMHCLHLPSCLFLSYFPLLIVRSIVMTTMRSSASRWLLLVCFFGGQYDWGPVIVLTWLSCHFILKLAAGLRQSSCQIALRRCVQPTDADTYTSKTSDSPWSPLMSVSPDLRARLGYILTRSPAPNQQTQTDK